MAGSLGSDFREIYGCKESRGYSTKKQLLSIPEIHSILLQQKENLHSGGTAMISYINSREFYDMQVAFPITKLQHVTIEENMSAILEWQCFRARSRRADLRDLSFWSAYIPVEDVSKASNEEYLKSGVKERFANSPAFTNEESRYGNFRFLFSLSDLLALYQTQHCGGKEPMIKYLATDLFKQEIAHYIVIHSPDSKDFDGYQQVPSVQPYKAAQAQDPVYWIDDKLYWRPESTADKLNVLFPKYYVWNHLIFAFHLPANRCLQIPRERLLENLSACSATERPYLGDSKTTREEAINIIKSIKERYHCH